MNKTLFLPRRVLRGVFLALAGALVVFAAGDRCAAQGSWLFAPGAYTHSPVTGTRTTQFASVEPVEGLPDPRATTSRYWRTRTQLRGVDGSTDTIYEVTSFGDTRGGYDAQRERGYDAQRDTLRSLVPFRNNPYLFFGGLQGYGYGLPGYPAAAPYGAPPAVPYAAPAPCEGEGCIESAPQYAPQAGPYPGQPGTAYPYAQPNAQLVPFPPYGYGPYGYGYGGYGRGGYERREPVRAERRGGR